jgi:hypothetical protein
MSINSRRNRGQKRGHRFIDDVTGQQGYSNRMAITEDGKVVRPENLDDPSTLKITLKFDDNEGYIDSKLVRPRPILGNGFTKDPYNFQSPIFDQIQTSSGAIIASLDPDIVLAQLESLKTWEEMEVLWDADLGQFASPYWNPLINLNINLYDNVNIFGDTTFVYDLDDEGGN